jgi:AcrR family transcriptional regulator
MIDPTSRHPSPRLQPPRQRRSQETLDRILEATNDLLESRSFSEVTVADIARAAGSSVGAFYARFHDKDALLDYFDETCADELKRTIERRVERWTRASAEDIVGEIVHVLVRFHRARRGVMRAIVVRSRGGAGPDGPRHPRTGSGPVAKLVARVTEERGRFDHPTPAQAVQLGMLIVLATIRERVLFADLPDIDIPASDSLLADELAVAYLRYLGL